jgi:hypothetical protein
MERKGQGGVREVLDEALAEGERAADPVEVAEADRRLDELLAKVGPSTASEERSEPAVPRAAPAGLAGVAMRTATPIRVRGRAVELSVRGIADPVSGELAPGVASELVALAAKNGDSVVLECVPGQPPLVVGVLQTRMPEELVLSAQKVRIEADQELLLRSGRGAMRIRRDGDVELVGSRISALSRGLFRLVGRVLRLN